MTEITNTLETLENQVTEAVEVLSEFRATKAEQERMIRDRALVEVSPHFEIYKSRRNTLLETVRTMAPCYGSTIPELSARLALYQKQVLDEAYNYATAKAAFYQALDKTGNVLKTTDPELSL